MMLPRCLALPHTLFAALDIKKDDTSPLVVPLRSHLRLPNYLLASWSTYICHYLSLVNISTLVLVLWLLAHMPVRRNGRKNNIHLKLVRIICANKTLCAPEKRTFSFSVSLVVN